MRLDPGLDSIITADSPLEVLGEHFGLTEGPVWVKDAQGGSLLFSDCAANVIYKWRPDAPLWVFLERRGFTGSNNLNAGDGGAGQGGSQSPCPAQQCRNQRVGKWGSEQESVGHPVLLGFCDSDRRRGARPRGIESESSPMFTGSSPRTAGAS